MRCGELDSAIWFGESPRRRPSSRSHLGDRPAVEFVPPGRLLRVRLCQSRAADSDFDRRERRRQFGGVGLCVLIMQVFGSEGEFIRQLFPVLGSPDEAESGKRRHVSAAEVGTDDENAYENWTAHAVAVDSARRRVCVAAARSCSRSTAVRAGSPNRPIWGGHTRSVW